MKTVIIFGGSGFVGHNIIRKMAKKGFKIIVPYQRPINEAKLRLYGQVGQIIPIRFDQMDYSSMETIIKSSHAVLNLKTIWSENKKNSYDKRIYLFNKQLLNIINTSKNNIHYIFFSGLGVTTNSISDRVKNIAKTEDYIISNSDNYSIIRPGIIIGGNDVFLGRMLPIIKYSPIVPLFGKGLSKIQPVYIEDVVDACMKIINTKQKNKEIYELFGNEIFTYKSLYEYLSDCLNVKRNYINLPYFLAMPSVYFMEKLSINIITKDQLLLFKKDNIPTKQYKDLTNLGIESSSIKESIKNIIKKYNYFA